MRCVSLVNEINDYSRSNNVNPCDNYTTGGNASNTNIQNKQQEIIIDLNSDNAIKAVIYSEILGKPRCKRKRWR